MCRCGAGGDLCGVWGGRGGPAFDAAIHHLTRPRGGCGALLREMRILQRRLEIRIESSRRSIFPTPALSCYRLCDIFLGSGGSPGHFSIPLRGSQSGIEVCLLTRMPLQHQQPALA